MRTAEKRARSLPLQKPGLKSSSADASYTPLMNRSRFLYAGTAGLALSSARYARDAESQRIAGDNEVNRLLARFYRAPWVHPAVA